MEIKIKVKRRKSRAIKRQIEKWKKDNKKETQKSDKLARPFFPSSVTFPYLLHPRISLFLDLI
jgi:hypothetical protein